VICEEPEPALLAFPDLGLDLDARNLHGELTRGDATDLLRAAIERGEELKDRLVLVELPAVADVSEHPKLEPEETFAWADFLRDESMPGGGRAAGFYHPWLRVRDPLGGLVAPLRYVPPCGHVAGVISRSDRERGASYTPANLPMYDAVDVARSYAEGIESELNRRGVNLIRCVPSAGLKVWGAGTLARSGPGDVPESRFIAHRRLINRLVRAIRRIAEPLVFDNNGPELWLTIFRGINSVLFEAFQHGALKGSRPEEAYVVRCDERTNTPDVIDAGRVYCEIEVAPAAPMEFILIGLSFGGDGRLEVFES
jgi:phage tail sheath protein FI